MNRVTYAIVGVVAGAALLVSRAPFSRGANGAPASAPDAATVAVAKVSRTDLARRLTLSAELQPFQEIAVHAKVAGYVRSIRVDVGDHVKAGDTIALLEIPEANDDVKRAAATSHAAEAEVRRAQAHYDDVHVASQRLLEVAKQQPNLIAQQDLDTARARDEDAAAGLEASRRRLEESQANQARMKTMLDYGSITAPFDGVVTKRYADVGALIQAGTSSNTQALPVVSLAQDRLLRLLFPVPETAVPFIREGTPVDVEVSARQRTFKGTVARFAGLVDRATRTMVTEVDVPNADLSLTPGMYASVRVTLEERKNALSVPIDAVAGGTVWAVNGGGALEERKVETGMETPDRLEIRSGVAENDLVVIGARARLRPGDRVRPKLLEVRTSHE
jgi:RND family efflux transporter MFP subunit